MIGLFDDDGDRLAVTLNTDDIVLNNPEDDKDDTYELNAVATAGQFDQTIDSEPSSDGSELSDVKRTLYVVRLDGVVRARSLAKLYDKKKALAAAFDPARLALMNADTLGIVPLDFSVPTTDTDNYATGFVASRYYVRSRGAVVPPDSEYTGTAAFFSIELLVPDPRRYLQTESSLTGAGTLDNSLADYPSYPTIEITMAGAGSSTYKVTRTGTYSTKDLTLDLSSLVNTDVVTIDMARKRIYVDDVETPSLYVSGDWFEIEPNSQTIAITNGTNATTVTKWRRAFTV